MTSLYDVLQLFNGVHHSRVCGLGSAHPRCPIPLNNVVKVVGRLRGANWRWMLPSKAGRSQIAQCLTSHAHNDFVLTPVSPCRLEVCLRVIFDSSRNDEEKLQVDPGFYQLFNCWIEFAKYNERPQQEIVTWSCVSQFSTEPTHFLCRRSCNTLGLLLLHHTLSLISFTLFLHHWLYLSSTTKLLKSL